MSAKIKETMEKHLTKEQIEYIDKFLKSAHDNYILNFFMEETN